MDAQDLIKIGRKAKSETEAFINRNLNDRAKGWPKLCFSIRSMQEITGSSSREGTTAINTPSGSIQ